MQVHVSVFLKTPDKHDKTQRRGEAGSLPAWGPRDSRHSPRVNSLGFLFTSHSSDWMFEKLSTQDLQRVPTKKKKTSRSLPEGARRWQLSKTGVQASLPCCRQAPWESAAPPSSAAARRGPRLSASLGYQDVPLTHTGWCQRPSRLLASSRVSSLPRTAGC